MCKICIKINVNNVSSQWSEKADFMVQVVTFLSVPGSQKSIQLGLWISEASWNKEPLQRNRETGNNSDKESLLMRGTDLLNENHTYVSY